MSKFKVDGHEGLVDTAKEVQKLLGQGIKMKDIIAGKVAGVTIVADDGAEPTAEEVIATVTAVLATETDELQQLLEAETDELKALKDAGELSDSTTETDEEFMSDTPEHVIAKQIADKADELEVAKSLLIKPTSTTPLVPATGDVEFPEVGTFADKKAMKKFVKKLSDAQLFDWLDLEGVHFTPCDHEAINRMRAAMAMTDKHFPKDAPTATKSKSKYADMSDEQLIKLAADKKVAVKDHKGDARIRRMYTIMALKAAGHLA